MKPQARSATGDDERLARLRMAARYHSQRRDLYRAKSYGPRATDPDRLRELEREADRATELLEAAEREIAQGAAAAARSPEPR
jgi:hypothetical protein